MAVTVNRARDINILKLYLEGVSAEDIAKQYQLQNKYRVQEILKKQPKILRRYMFENELHVSYAKTLEEFVETKDYWLLLISRMQSQST